MVAVIARALREETVATGTPLREALSKKLLDVGRKMTADDIIIGLESLVREAGGKEAAIGVLNEFVNEGLLKYAEDDKYVPTQRLGEVFILSYNGGQVLRG